MRGRSVDLHVRLSHVFAWGRANFRAMETDGHRLPDSLAGSRFDDRAANQHEGSASSYSWRCDAGANDDCGEGGGAHCWDHGRVPRIQNLCEPSPRFLCEPVDLRARMSQVVIEARARQRALITNSHLSPRRASWICPARKHGSIERANQHAIVGDGGVLAQLDQCGHH